MSNRKPLIFALFTLLMISASYLYLTTSRPSDGLPDPEDIVGYELANIPPVEKSIQFFQNKIKQNPRDGVSYTLLGDLYLRQARETGNVAGYQLAEEALLEALDVLPNYAPAATSLAAVYYSQHEFEKALELAEQVYETSYRNSHARLIMADSYLSLGDYQKAEMIYDELEEINATPPLLARIAYLEELKGNTDIAMELIRRAAGHTLQSGGTTENAAWYLLRVGDMNFNIGKIRESGEFYEASLRVFENYSPALAGLGKVRAAEGKYDEAIRYYQQAVNIIPQPEFIAALGDLYLITGQSEKAQIQYETVEAIGMLAASNQQVYNRQLANFYSDHDLNLDHALDLALAELETRQDIYGYDSLAWAYYKNGHYEDAQTMIERALLLGTRDARLYYHAGMIALALENKSQARDFLDRALTINPHFSVLFAAEARQTLQLLQSTAIQ